MTSSRLRPVSSEDQGFTLVEMVISFLILGIIIAPLVSSYILGLGATTATAQSVANSSDAQTLAAYFTGDIAGANSLSTTDTSPGGCAPAGSSVLIQTQQTDLSSSSSPSIYVTYVAVQNTAAQNDLHLGAGSVYEIDRVVCNASGPTNTLTLARTVKNVPTVCDQTNACPPVVANATKLTINVDEYEFGSYAPPKLSGFYSYSITGTRRVTS